MRTQTTHFVVPHGCVPGAVGGTGSFSVRKWTLTVDTLAASTNVCLTLSSNDRASLMFKTGGTRTVTSTHVLAPDRSARRSTIDNRLLSAFEDVDVESRGASAFSNDFLVLDDTPASVSSAKAPFKS